MRIISKTGFSLLFAATFIACGSDGSDTEDDVIIPDNRMAVSIDTRADGGLVADGLEAGLFMVNYNDNLPDELLSNNNYIHNQRLIWKNDRWETATPFYWFDDTTPADFYAYAPYQSVVTNARQMSFSVEKDQRTTNAFAQSDLLWGKVEGQTPSSGSFSLILAHQLSQLTVKVTADAGFSDGELKAEDVSVTIGGTKTRGVVDVATGKITATDEVQDVQCLSNGDLSYSAVLLPQQVPFSNLIQVDWQGNKYTLQNTFTLEAKRQYTLTVKLKKTKSGFEIGIEGWDILPEDFGGSVGG